ncbi:MAG: tRNA pseudouridine(55) synthase TruB [Bacteroidales bacterium]|nr:tRNA pseudouridine(55) synthase TruB [Bacteroidales bacterium]
MTCEQLLEGVVLPIDKPRQWTSFQTVNKIKAVVRNAYGLKKFKIGHAGTLDPLATGLLLVCIGKATKSIPQLQDGDKEYSGTMVLGATTPCFDLEQAIDKYYPYTHITQAFVKAAAQKLTGAIMQTPPIFSAVKIDGQRAYEYARRDDQSATIEPKQVVVHRFEISEFRPGSEAAVQVLATTPHQADAHHLYDNPQGCVPPFLPQADFRIHCGKGTYIRSLARDLGTELGSGAFLCALRRERIGNYHVDNALQLDDVADYLATS